ncbi:amidohydrolase family protein [Nitrincola sp.]|uniref:amidohydrolase family protein n=1 Tax=Nitrincola sp. TaxID=1926584 RepID=UPI003A8EA76A
MQKTGFDCHAHVYGVVNSIQGSNYRPVSPAPLTTWQQHLHSVGLEGGVIVQPSFLGHDNQQLLDSLVIAGKGFKGVAQLPCTASLAEMQALDRAGIVGVRWNLIEHRAELPNVSALEWSAFLERIKLLDWHLELHLEGDRLPELLPALLEQGVKLVIDHIGLPYQDDPGLDAGFQQLLNAGQDGRVWAKLSAPYRSPVNDIRPYVEALLTHLGSERLVWGSDWPWTRHEDKHSYADTLAWLKTWVTDPTALTNILENSPRELYRIA